MLGFHTSVGQAPFGFCCCTQFSSYSGLVKTQQLWSPRRRRSSAAAAGKNGGLLLLGNKSLSYNYRRKHKSQSCRALEGQLPKAEEGNAAGGGGGGGATTRGSMFGTEQELSGPQKFLEGLPASARYATSAVIVVGALAAGYALGARVKGTQGAAVGGALALGAIGGASAFALNAAAPHVAAVQVRNALVNHSDPSSLRSTEIDAIAQKYGVSRRNERFNAELRDLYDRYVTEILPPGNEDLKGDEADSILAFKNALGLDDPDAAAVHIEIGRRIFRQRLETGNRESAVEERRTFQKLVYVSTLVFGEASKFLLPWKRVFKVTDAQIDVAIRDNAQRLFTTQLATLGSDLDVEKIKELRTIQLKVKLSDEVASQMFRDYAQKQIEAHITSALEVLKSRARIKDTGKMVREMENVLAYNAKLSALAAIQADASFLLPGIGPVTVLGGQFESDRQMDDLKQLYRIYLSEAFAGGRLEDDKVVALGHLRNTFGMGKRESEDVLQEVTVKVYRRRLSQAVQGGDLDAAPSKAAFLQELCDTLQFDPEKAAQVHTDIYRQKLEQCVADGSLNDEDVSALLRLRVLLCIPQETVDSAHADICGRLFTKIVDDAISAGVDGYDMDMKAAVRNGVIGLRLTQEAAMAIASKAVRAVFLTYVKRSKTAGSRVESARELKKMVIFSNLVVAELIVDIRGDSPEPEETKKEEEKPVKTDAETDEDDWENLQSLRKTRKTADIEGRMEKKSQAEITLVNELELRDRTDLYRTFLLYCLSGETTGMPMGTQIVTQRDSTEFVRLGQLGTILGLNQKEVADVHKGLAEQAFRQQAQVILADGQLNKARMQDLTELQKQLGLPADSAQTIIQSITKTKMSGAIEAAINQGRLSIDEVKELREAGVDVNGIIPKEVRQKLFKKVVDRTFSSGTGDFDETELYEKIPAELGISVDIAKRTVQDLAKERLSNSLVQAVSLLRQKKPGDVVATLNNLLACDKAVPSPPLSWPVKEELIDLYCIYLKDSQSAEKAARLQELLGIDESQASSLKEMVTTSGFSLGLEEEEFSF